MGEETFCKHDKVAMICDECEMDRLKADLAAKDETIKQLCEALEKICKLPNAEEDMSWSIARDALTTGKE